MSAWHLRTFSPTSSVLYPLTNAVVRPTMHFQMGSFPVWNPVKIHTQNIRQRGLYNLPFNTNLYRVFSEFGLVTLTMTKTCWNWERTVRGEKGWAPGSWNTMVTMSLPMWRFRSSCKPTVKYRLCYHIVLCCDYTTNWIPATAKLGKLQPFQC